MKMEFVYLTKGKNKQILFLLLTTTLLIYLFINTKAYGFILNQWNKTATASFTSPKLEFRSAIPPFKPAIPSTGSSNQSEAAPPRCSYKYLSPDNSGEGRRLLDSISWPETQSFSKPFSLSATTSSAKSSFAIVPLAGGWRVGDNLTVQILLKDYTGKQKKGGGDFLTAKLHNRQLGAGVVGQVRDYLNGGFSAVFPLLWSGTAEVEVTLVHPSESITVLKRLMEKDPDRVAFVSVFKSGSVTESSICNVCLDPAKAPLCNFTDCNTGEQWFCYKPKTLDCSSRISHSKGPFTQTISKDEEALFKSGVNMKVPILANGKSTILILPQEGAKKTISPEPSGYYYGNQWRPLQGPPVRPFNDAAAITACLKGKQMHMFGDSTIRQFYTYITAAQPNLQTFDKRSSFQCGPFFAVDRTNDITVTHRCHGPPIRSNAVLVSQLKYVANELDRLAGGPDTVVVIGVWAHFATFTMEVYYQRLMTIRKAIQRLLNRAPGTKVIIRSANMRTLSNLFLGLTNSDWFSLQMDKVLRAVFKNTDVFFLDTWDMVQAHYYPHDVHPPAAIIKLIIDRILSYTCPEKGN